MAANISLQDCVRVAVEVSLQCVVPAASIQASRARVRFWSHLSLPMSRCCLLPAVSVPGVQLIFSPSSLFLLVGREEWLPSPCTVDGLGCFALTSVLSCLP